MERILGLDLTKQQVSWALVEHDSQNNENNLIVDCGGLRFNAGEIPKTGEPTNKTRRNKRLMRRTIAKKRKRKNEIRELFISYGLFPPNVLDVEEFSNWLHSKKGITSPWDLRASALERKLEPEELGRALYAIVAHRGYQFTKAEEASHLDGDSSKMRDATKELVKNMEDKGAETIGQYLALYENRKRNTHINKTKNNGDVVLGKDGKPEKVASYDRSVSRYLLKDEVKKIFEKQQQFGNEYASDEVLKKFSDLAFYMPDPQSTESLVGYCTFYRKEKRAAKAQYEAEIHVALTKILNCRIENFVDGVEKPLLEYTSMEAMLDLAKEKQEVTYGQLRKLIGLTDKETFKGLKYRGKATRAKQKDRKNRDSDSAAPQIDENIVLDLAKAENKSTFISLKGYHELKKALGEDEVENLISEDIYNDIVWVLTVEKGDDSRKLRLQKIMEAKNISNASEKIEKLLFTNPKVFKDHHALSLKALKQIVYAMREGLRYDEAIAHLGLKKFEPKKDRFLPALNKTDLEVNSPRVQRMYANLRKVYNGIVRYHGSPNRVHIEANTDLGTLALKKTIETAQREREKAKKIASQKIIELFGDKVKTSAKNIKMLTLYEQQSGIDLYTGLPIELESLYEGDYTIDYILPLSRSFDDRYSNTVLTSKQAKIIKADRTPFEWFGEDDGRWENFKQLLASPTLISQLGKGKVGRLLKENFNEQNAKEYRERSIENDRSYALQVVKEVFERYVELPRVRGKQQVFTRNKWLSANLRRQWTTYEDRIEYDGSRINVLNAIMVAFSTQKMVQDLAQYFKWRETEWENERPEFKTPYDGFKDDVKTLLQFDRGLKDRSGKWRDRLLISRTPNKTVTGAGHLDTTTSPKSPTAKVPIRQGKAYSIGNGDIARADIYRYNGQNRTVVVYVRNVAAKQHPMADCKGDDMSKGGEYLFSLQSGDLVSVDGEMMFISSFDSSNGQWKGLSSSNKEKRLTVTKKSIKKLTIDPLGFYS